MKNYIKIPKNDVISKQDKIFEAITGKKILHLGALGMSPEKFQNSLHCEMRKYAKYLVGVDIDKEAIELLKPHDIVYGSIENLEQINDIKKIEWDVIVAADVIEHTSNPGNALAGIKKCMTEKTKLIITLPNVYSIRFLYYAIRSGIFNRENYHVGHTFWPSYETFMLLIKEAGLEVDSFNFCMYVPMLSSPKSIKIIFKLLNVFPIYSSGLFFVLKNRGI
jgi:2-polyprenyl-3-methyl-5-hydroxy-6-metoxy-1,4-benzoquinol methylase